MKNKLWIIICALLLASFGVSWAEEGLVAHYTFDEGKGSIAADSSGNHNDGTIHNAKWVPVSGGYALKFNGSNALVDCGNSPSLDIRGPMTMSAWIFPAGQQNGAEPGILGKQFNRFLLTLWGADLTWYINWGTGGNYSLVSAPSVGWFHVATSYDGKAMQIYVNGVQLSNVSSNITTINGGGRFAIGCVIGDSESKDAVISSSAYFNGYIDEVRLYNRALSSAEISAQYQADRPAERNKMLASTFVPIKSVKTIRKDGVSVGVGKNGGVEITNGKDSLVMESSYSFPDKQIGLNYLSETEQSGDPLWKTNVKKTSESRLSVVSGGSFYTLKRNIAMRNGRIEIEDTLTNLKQTPLAVIVNHNITASGDVTNQLARGNAQTPMIYFTMANSDFGVICEDDIGRLQFDGTCLANRATIRHSHFALDVGKSYTFKYALYPMKKTGDVFDFVNQVRRDWKSNFTIDGEWYYIDLSSPMLKEPEMLKDFLERRNVHLIALTPFLDYDPGAMDHVLTRDEYKLLADKAIKALKAAKPGINVVGSIETDWYSIFPDKIKNGSVIINGNAQQIADVINAANLECNDSIKRENNGTMKIEYMHRGGKDQFAIGVYPRPGNFMHKFLIDQIRYLLDEVHLDGIYIDEFSQAWYNSIKSYEGWDGTSVNIDLNTGEITQKYIDCSLTGINSRVAIIKAALNRKKSITANSYSSSGSEQSLKAWRFSETQSDVIRNLPKVGEEPPFIGKIFDGVFGSPIGLGVTQNPSEPDLAKGLMLAIISYLRHGAVIYHYSYPELPKTGFGSGEYGPMNHMFPITPVELHKGWIKGKERIISAISINTLWKKSSTPILHLFDLSGREVDSKNNLQASKEGNVWRIKLNIKDWAEIAVIE